MAFRFDVLNLEILDSANEVFAKPSTQWTDGEHTRAVLIIEAMRIVASQYRPATNVTENKGEPK